MNLYILQHGEAVAEEVDPQRPLSEQGRQDVRLLATRLQERGVQLGAIMHSGKLRAVQSASLMAETLAPGITPIIADGLKPNDDPAMFASAIMPQGKDIMVVSHMPLVSRLCSVLLTGYADTEFASAPGTLFCLDNKNGIWRLHFMLRPEFLTVA
ncbi:MAG: phosphohistidine phosphatase SixA [Gammaproteobacteria bacterium]|nr:phosphohistidine phosphatase SixA [Gammaproteobacteria bacterium]